MQRSLKIKQFPHFLRKWSESNRTISNNKLKNTKYHIALSNNNSNAEKMRKNNKIHTLTTLIIYRLIHQEQRILYPIPNYSKLFIIVFLRYYYE